MDKGGAAIHLDPPPFYPPNISWISTKRLLDIHDICFSYLFLPPVHFKMCLIHTFASEDPRSASIRRRGPRDAVMLMAWYMTIILAFREGRISEHHLAWADYHKGPIITIWSLQPLEFRGCCQLISALTKI